jgi:hypothetical protein
MAGAEGLSEYTQILSLHLKGPCYLEKNLAFESLLSKKGRKKK